ncbi:5-oxoprolinase subunit C family protein [Cognatitamlana onchidii]|uniref:5-oxoprolinase subunit C family protein n=1 Tax=Cognatitamlana onchidii TaxID=2562860 RepID=UPI0010A6A0D0|nr:biotin-dependent carboxyltransferase family protein [Algibacter onchidii]
MVRVIKAGILSSIQDMGRMGYQNLGIPYSGAMDAKAALMANAVLGNKSNDAILEMTMTGDTLKFECETLICLTGAFMSPKLNQKSIVNNKVVEVRSGDVLSFGALKTGFRTYLAVKGGFQSEKVLGSRSMYSGITDTFKLKKGAQLSLNSYAKGSGIKYAGVKVNDSYFNSQTIRVYKGPEFYLLSEAQQHKLMSHVFTISKHNNRMAYQLNELLDNSLDQIITSPVLPGTVQLTPSGNLIVLMRDCQTTGGYPRVLQLTEAAINTLAQKYTGQTIQFL